MHIILGDTYAVVHTLSLRKLSNDALCFPADPDGGPGMLLDVECSEGNKFLSVQYAKVCTLCSSNSLILETSSLVV